MSDGPTSDQLRQRALRHIDPRGRPSLPGPGPSFFKGLAEDMVRTTLEERWNALELVMEEQTMRDEVEGYGRKAPDAGTMEAAGIEPALDSLPMNGKTYRPRFEHWKLDGGSGGSLDVASPSQASEATRMPEPHHSFDPPSNFSAKTTICGIDFEVKSEGKHLNLHLIDEELFLWRFEPLETAIPKLEAILGAARLAANSA